VSGFKKDRQALTFEERAAFSELAGELSLPNVMFEEPELRAKVEEAFDQAEIPRYVDELEEGAYEALLEWIELRPESETLKFDDGTELEIVGEPLYGQDRTEEIAN
jgi:hypothetical protein